MMLLVINVVLDLVFVGADGGYEVSACPEGALGEFLGLLLEPHGTLPFQDLHDVRC